MDAHRKYNEATTKTGESLKSIATSSMIQDLSSLSLPEINQLVDLVARVAPAGNVPSMILNGLARLPGRRLPKNVIKRDINLLFKGIEQTLWDRAIYSAFFAGPAAIIWAYQNLLRLAGKDLDASFPEGAWQFYADYALRDDTARHANETHGFDTALKQHQIRLSPVDRVAAWVMAAVDNLHQYDRLLANEWRERVYAYTLSELTADRDDDAHYRQLYRQWEQLRPYSRGPDVNPNDDYPAYRRRKFDQFLEAQMTSLPDSLRREWQSKVKELERRQLAGYQRQMSILTYLQPDSYSETRRPIPLSQAHVGIIYRNVYYLLPICRPGTEEPVDATTVRQQIAALLNQPDDRPPARLNTLATVKRAYLPNLFSQLNRPLCEGLTLLRRAPIWLNLERQPAALPLAALRRAERGVGDHALTIFDTGRTFVFDQSHIFFDGAWGAAVAEILTNEALAWAVYLHTLPPAEPQQPPTVPTLPLTAEDKMLIAAAPQAAPEAWAETDAIDLKSVQRLRRLFKQRNDLIRLTVNDLLVLYRAIHAAAYQTGPLVAEQLAQLAQDDIAQEIAKTTLEAIENESQINPAILIPIDASKRSPRDRLFPMTFEVPLAELDLLNLHRQTMAALNQYRQADQERTIAFAQFEQIQRTYLRVLAGFGELLSRAKEIAVAGESGSVSSIKLLAHIPKPLQHLLDKIPKHFDILNDIIKGREVISNIGAVAPGSTLTRFLTAKDDNEKKSLCWGVLTDAEGIMRITLRDFRPHVAQLKEIGEMDIAHLITQDYLDAYALGFNNFIRDLQQITLTSRETLARRPTRPRVEASK